MLSIMNRRIQVYLSDDIWRVLDVLSRQQGTSISELVRQALLDKYRASSSGRREVMQGLVGLWRNRKTRLGPKETVEQDDFISDGQ
jgi:metal-responsive CopG/Arc/MetJ family transcriptional regulator